MSFAKGNGRIKASQAQLEQIKYYSLITQILELKAAYVVISKR